MLSREQATRLMDLAIRSIRHGLERGKPLPVQTEGLEAVLLRHQASFVTLELRGRLRGCIGSLEAHRPLAQDVAANAYAAAFRDPRFPPVNGREIEYLDVHISLLTPPEPLSFDSQTDLLRQVRPGIDGLILQEGALRATFLPSVWESLPVPEEFLRHLKQKAGLSMDYWSDTLKVFRYRTEVLT